MAWKATVQSTQHHVNAGRPVLMVSVKLDNEHGTSIIQVYELQSNEHQATLDARIKETISGLDRLELVKASLEEHPVRTTTTDNTDNQNRGGVV